MKRIITLTAMFAILITGMLYAEKTDNTGGFGYSTGVIIWNSNVSALNKALSSQGYSGFDQFDYSYGGGGGFLMNNFYIGGWGFGSIYQLQVDNPTSSNYIKKDSGAGGFDLGYLAFNTKNFFVIPTAGFLWGGGVFSVFNALPTSTQFSGLLADPGNITQISYDNYSLSISLQTGIKFGYMGLYIRSGYIFTPITTWSIKGYSGNLTGAPSMSEHSVFVAVGAVFGSMGNDRKYNFKEVREKMK
ncbi:MAG: hypothetical protein J7K04_00520 [Spirochaetales bacterium]|nr:hypothetical protein [Spirochaetales bacterium]